MRVRKGRRTERSSASCCMMGSAGSASSEWRRPELTVTISPASARARLSAAPIARQRRVCHCRVCGAFWPAVRSDDGAPRQSWLPPHGGAVRASRDAARGRGAFAWRRPRALCYIPSCPIPRANFAPLRRSPRRRQLPQLQRAAALVRVSASFAAAGVCVGDGAARLTRRLSSRGRCHIHRHVAWRWRHGARCCDATPRRGWRCAASCVCICAAARGQLARRLREQQRRSAQP
jgi:hypothetical protein